MKNATQNPIGNHSTARRQKTKATAPAVKGIRTMDASAQRQFGNTKRPMEISPRFTASDAFLKTSFMPLLKENDITEKQSQRRNAKTERDCYKSLSQLAEHYDIQPIPTKHFGYPYNVRLALMDVQKQLKAKTENWAGVQIIEKNDKAYFTVKKDAIQELLCSIFLLYLFIDCFVKRQEEKRVVYYFRYVPIYTEMQGFPITEWKILISTGITKYLQIG
ncbi:hypothetical protein EG349_12900 [Chryseobacterium shandongense]|uniref:Uncharacterized protein n=1 Tax=Chryseobacterium shandongense TaxID=1493872 RepID=A0AAD0YHC9_9FLAO|nr:hypothetical protein [Chryseobacterium shandongense]AZA87623.1 hypothetical protein EG349_12900 [Chryseobacterium shandongense]AZA96122.1 hypothetical protein EG353_11360 [Chryseobacterium shandongense]